MKANAAVARVAGYSWLWLTQLGLADVMVTVPAGWSTLANPLDRGGNTVVEVLPSVPEETLWLFLDDCDFVVNSYQFGAWSIPDLPFAPGRGVLVFNGGQPFEVRFEGAEPTSTAPPVLEPGWHLVNLAGWSLEDLRAQDGDRMLRLTPQGGWDNYFFDGLFDEWIPAPDLAPNEAFFYRRAPGKLECQPDSTIVYLGTRVLGLGIDARVYDAQGQPRTGATWRAQLWAGSSVDVLQRVGEPVGFGVDAGAGYITATSPQFARVPGVSPGETLFVQLRGWDSAYGASYQEVLEGGAGAIFRSEVIAVSSVPIAEDLQLPAFLEGLPSIGMPSGHVEVRIRIERFEGGWALVVTAPTGLPGDLPFKVESSADLLGWSEWGSFESPVWNEPIPLSEEAGATRYFRASVQLP